MSLWLSDVIGEKVEIDIFTSSNFCREYYIAGKLEYNDGRYYIGCQEIDTKRIKDIRLMRTDGEREQMKKEFRNMLKRLDFSNEEEDNGILSM